MIIVLTFFLNAVLNFAIGLAVAAILGPKSYGEFAVASMAAIVLSTSLFEWLRLSATRFYNERTRDNDPDLRSSLEASYLIAGGLLAAGTLVAAVVGAGAWSAILVVVVAATGFANGQFEFRSALARSRFLNATYAQLVLSKNALALGLMTLAAFLFHSGTWVLAALSLSIVISITLVWPRLRDPKARFASIQWNKVTAFGKYGVPIVIANVLYQIILLANRWIVATKLGYADAGQLSLATDLTIRIFLSLGAGFDLLLFQIAVRQEAMQGLFAAKEQIARNMLLIAAVLFPAACGYAVTLPFFVQLVVPAAYHADFVKISLLLIPGVLAFCITQFAFSPIFQLTHKTKTVTGVAIVAAACDIALIALLPAGANLVDFAAVHSISLVAASVAAGLYALREKECIPRFYDVAAIIAATGIMVVTIWPLRTINPAWLGLSCTVAAGALVYLIFILLFNVANIRGILNIDARFLGKPTL